MSDALLTRFNFLVDIYASQYGGDSGIAYAAKGAFSEVTGLEVTLEPMTFREGGYHAGPRQLIGKTSVATLVLKRGVSLDSAFWDWIGRCTDGTYPLPYVSGSIRMRPPDGEVSGDEAAWSFTNGIVTKVKSADLSASDPKDVPIEELHIVHEGLSRGAS
jgi:phage tail-like protein